MHDYIFAPEDIFNLAIPMYEQTRQNSNSSTALSIFVNSPHFINMLHEKKKMCDERYSTGRGNV